MSFPCLCFVVLFIIFISDNNIETTKVKQLEQQQSDDQIVNKSAVKRDQQNHSVWR